MTDAGTGFHARTDRPGDRPLTERDRGADGQSALNYAQHPPLNIYAAQVHGQVDRVFSLHKA